METRTLVDLLGEAWSKVSDANPVMFGATEVSGEQFHRLVGVVYEALKAQQEVLTVLTRGIVAAEADTVRAAAQAKTLEKPVVEAAVEAPTPTKVLQDVEVQRQPDTREPGRPPAETASAILAPAPPPASPSKGSAPPPS